MDHEKEEALKAIFGNDGYNRLKNNPTVSPIMEDPEFVDMIKDIRENPGSILKYQSKLSNPLALMQILPYLTQKEEDTEEKQKKDQLLEAEKAKTKGNEFFSKGNYEEALKMYDKAIELNPNNVLYKTNKCTALINMKDYQNAIAAALSAVSTGKRNFAPDEQMWKAYMKLGTAYRLANDKKQAISAFESAFRIKQDKITVDALEQANKMKD